MDFRLHFLPSEALETTAHDSLGFQSALTWRTDRTRAVFGVDADFTTGTLFEFQDRPTVGPFVQGLHYDYEVDAQVFAAFGQLRHALTDTLTLEGGARVETTSYEYDNRAPDGAILGAICAPPTEAMTSPPSRRALGHLASQRAVQLFSRIARGVRAPQTAELYRLAARPGD
jgi:iron complex outermembrane receptor protein